MVNDIVFNEHYAKKMGAMIQAAGQDGFNQGFAHCVSIIAHFNEMEMPVTPKTIELFLQGRQNLEMKKAEARHQAKENITTESNPCCEIPLQPTKPSPLTIVK